MACEFTTTDCFGREVTLDHSNWESHVEKRPEIASRHDLLPLVLEAPEIVFEDDGNWHFYRRSFPSVVFMRVWLRVVVREFPDGAKIVTAWLSGKIERKGVQRWP